MMSIEKKPLGLLLGSGDLPQQIVALCKEKQNPFVIIAFKGQTDPALVEKEEHLWVSVGDVEKPLQYLKEKGVKDLVFSGGIKRPALKHLALDPTAAKWLAKIGMCAFGDDGLLSGVIKLVQKQGFRVQGVQDFLKNLQAAPGMLTNKFLGPLEWADIKRGVDALDIMGPLDIGQGVIVEGQVILSVEGAEGTDALIKRTKDLQKTERGGVLVKLPKPNQSHLIDLPTIGPKTLQYALEAGLQGIAIGARSTLVIDKEKVVEEANAKGFFIAAIDEKRKIFLFDENDPA